MKRIACYTPLVAFLAVATVLGCCRYTLAGGRVGVSVGVGGCGTSVGVGYGSVGVGHVGYGHTYAAAYAPTVSTFLYPFAPTAPVSYAAPVALAAAPPCVCPQVPVGVPAQQYAPPPLAEPAVAAPAVTQTYSNVSTVGVAQPYVGASYAAPVGVGGYGVGLGAVYGTGLGVGYGSRVSVGVGYGVNVGVGRVFVPTNRARVRGVRAAPVIRVRVSAGGRRGLLERVRERRSGRRASLDCPDPEFANA